MQKNFLSPSVHPSKQRKMSVTSHATHSPAPSLAPSLFDPRPGPNQSRKEGGDIALPGGPTRRTTPSGRTWRTTTSTPLWLSLKYRFSPSQPNSVRSKFDRTAGCYLRNSEKGQVPRRTVFSLLTLERLEAICAIQLIHDTKPILPGMP